ncbi:MAG: Calx-beta domain-containing protein [Cyanobacteria bacterium P01_D01_bin.50]
MSITIPDSTEVNLVNSDSQNVGVASLSLDENGNYKITLSPFENNDQFNFAYLIDVSGSMEGEPLEEAKKAYISLTESLIDDGIADVSQFAVIPFSSDASLFAPLSALDAISTVQGLSASGFSNFDGALKEANNFFSTVPPGATNVAYFISDGFSTMGGDFTNSANALQAVADVQAYGWGAANIQELEIIDSDQPVIVSEASDLAIEFADSVLDRNDISSINILLDGAIVDTIEGEQLENSPAGLTFEGSIEGLNPSEDIQNRLTAEIVYTQGVPKTTVDLIVSNPLENNSDIDGGNDTEIASPEDKVIEDNSSDPSHKKDEEKLVVDSVTQPPQTFPLTEVDNVTKPGSNVDPLTVLNFEDISILEGDIGTTIAQFAVNLSSPATEQVEFSYETVDGSAIAGFDFNETSGEIIIPVGETTANIDIEVNGDSEVELNEEFTLNLKDLSGATFANNEAEYRKVAVIENDDVAQSSPIVPQNVSESTQIPDEGNIIDGNLLNLESFTGDVRVRFTIGREALFDNTAGFYKIDDTGGTITDPLTGEKLKPSDGEAYAQLAVELLEPGLELSVDNFSSITIDDTLMGGHIYAPLLVVDGDFDNLEEDLSKVNFSFAEANSDGIEHVRFLGNNTLGFEDLPGGGDFDFDDMLITAEIAMV